MQDKIILLVGESASGKDRLANRLEQDGYKVLKSYATRPKREGEGNTHVFITNEEVDKYKKEMIAYTKIGSLEYFATLSQLYDNDIYIIDPSGIDYMNKKIKDIKSIVVYINVDEQTRIKRAKKRGDKEEVWQKRFVDELDQFTEFKKKAKFDYSICNYDFDKAYKILKFIVDTEMKENKIDG